MAILGNTVVEKGSVSRFVHIHEVKGFAVMAIRVSKVNDGS